jgi:hypothetical protein
VLRGTKEITHAHESPFYDCTQFPTVSPLFTVGKNKVGYFLDRPRILTDNALYMTICRSLQMYILEERTQDYKVKWYNHKLRMDSSRPTQKVKNYQPDGGCNVGRLRRQWKDSL